MARLLGFLCFFTLVDPLFAKDEAVVFVVDPSWDCVASYVANVPLLQEYKIIKVMTHLGDAAPCNSDHAEIYRNITYNSGAPNDVLAAEEICPLLLRGGVPVAAVIATFDPAVALTDRLAACLGVRGNPVDGVQGSLGRHDKWFMSGAVRKAGLRAVKEIKVSTWPEAKEFLESLSPPLSDANPVIFKILQGSSSEGVQKVHGMRQAEEILSRELGSNSKIAGDIGEVLIQEFLGGVEYVIDSSSRDGVHKVNMVWIEDLRPGNGIFNLYYGFKAMDPEDEKVKAVIEYANRVLDATGVRNGASDMEVKWIEEEGRPCLIDLNARWTALMWTDGLALEKAVVGYDQITSTINAYLDGDAFNEMPLVPSLRQHGAIIFTNVWHTGILRGVPGLAIAEKLPSYFGSYNKRAVVGQVIEKYTAGKDREVTLLFADKDQAVVDADYNRIIDLEYADAFFDIGLAPSTGYVSLPALHMDGSGAIAALAILAFAVVVTVVAKSRRNLRDGTEYLCIA